MQVTLDLEVADKQALKCSSVLNIEEIGSDLRSVGIMSMMCCSGLVN